MRRALVLLSLGLVIAPAAHAQAPQTGRLLVTLAPGAASGARVTAAALAAKAPAKPKSSSARPPKRANGASNGAKADTDAPATKR